jgi:hypothetical protein
MKPEERRCSRGSILPGSFFLPHRVCKVGFQPDR